MSCPYKLVLRGVHFNCVHKKICVYIFFTLLCVYDNKCFLATWHLLLYHHSPGMKAVCVCACACMHACIHVCACVCACTLSESSRSPSAAWFSARQLLEKSKDWHSFVHAFRRPEKGIEHSPWRALWQILENYGVASIKHKVI